MIPTNIKEPMRRLRTRQKKPVLQVPEDEKNQSGNNDDSVEIRGSNEKPRQPSIKQERRNVDTDANPFPGLPELPERSFIWRQQDLFLHSGPYYTWIPNSGEIKHNRNREAQSRRAEAGERTKRGNL